MTTVAFRNAGSPTLELQDLNVARGSWTVGIEALRLEAGESAALVGPSGCGKTSLLLGMTGGLRGVTVSGGRRFNGQDWPDRDTSAWRRMLAGRVTVLLQDAKAALDPLLPVGAQMAAVTETSAASCTAALGRLGLEHPDRIAGSPPHRLSGGQAQKVLLAIAMLRGPQLLIADEPTTGLDGRSVEGFLSDLDLLRREHRCAVLLATHDLELVAAVGARPFGFGQGRFAPIDPGSFRWPPFERDEPAAVVVQVRGLSKSFGSLRVLRDVDLDLRRGEIVAVVGPTGSGKSTLAAILAGHLAPDRGAAAISEHSRHANPRVGRQLLFQDAFASLTPHRRVGSLIAETASHGFDQEAEARSIGLDPEVLGRTAAELSGGERRRVALLRALSVEPSLLILDEPTASLDRETAASVMTMVAGAQRRWRFACLLITHDAEMGRALAHRVLELRDGRLI